MRNPEDPAGVRLRVTDDSDTLSMFIKLGGSPTILPAAELTRALQSGRIDGLDGTLMAFRSGRIDETEKMCSLTAHIWDGYWVCAHAKTWATLPDDVRMNAARALDAAALAQRQDVVLLEGRAHEALANDRLAF